MYIRAKQIPKNTSTGTRYYTYFYLVSGTRHGSKVKQKVIRYLGKNPNASVIKRYGPLPLSPPELGTTTPAPGLEKSLNFTPITNTKGHSSQKFLLHWAREFGVRRVVFDSAEARAEDARGFYHPFTREIHIAVTASRATTYTLAHEIGHLIDFHMLQEFHQSARFASPDLKAELDELSKQRMDWVLGGVDARLENAARYARCATSARTQAALRRWVRHVHRKREKYFELHVEQFADLFACCVLEPRKTKAVAPTAYRLLLAQCQAHPKLAAFLQALQTPKKLDKA